jgi:hypothetical protein
LEYGRQTRSWTEQKAKSEQLWEKATKNVHSFRLYGGRVAAIPNTAVSRDITPEAVKLRFGHSVDVGHAPRLGQAGGHCGVIRQKLTM